jgi:hypothetical protein
VTPHDDSTLLGVTRSTSFIDGPAESHLSESGNSKGNAGTQTTSRFDLNYLIPGSYDYQIAATFVPPRQLRQHGPLDKGALSGRVALVRPDWESESMQRQERDNPQLSGINQFPPRAAAESPVAAIIVP